MKAILLATVLVVCQATCMDTHKAIPTDDTKHSILFRGVYFSPLLID